MCGTAYNAVGSGESYRMPLHVCDLSLQLHKANVPADYGRLTVG
jgi:hypothetical protein